MNILLKWTLPVSSRLPSDCDTYGQVVLSLCIAGCRDLAYSPK